MTKTLFDPRFEPARLAEGMARFMQMRRVNVSSRIALLRAKFSSLGTPPEALHRTILRTANIVPVRNRSNPPLPLSPLVAPEPLD